MSYHEYLMSRAISAQDPPFYALVMAAMRQADTTNTTKLRQLFPDVWEEFQARYHAPGGLIDGDKPAAAPDTEGDQQ